MRFSVLLFVAALAVSPAAAQPYERERAAAAELAEICAADAASLWGVNLCGPLLVVEPGSRAAWASQADALGVLTPSGDGWTGVLPDGVPLANTSLAWAGDTWIMALAPLPESAEDRRVLLAHEAWHRIQDQIGLTAVGTDAPHLESEQGRVLMRLEMRALARAMENNGRTRWNAARDALSFRAARLAEFPGASDRETGLDRNEGLAAYTGVRLGAADADAYATRTLARYDEHQALARAYAYATGPAYGLLLDGRERGWRSALDEAAPADLLSARLRPRVSAAALRRSMARYDGATVAAEEAARAEAQRAIVAETRARFSEGPRLVLPLTNAQFEFDPNQVTPVEGLGGVYRVLTIRDQWGELRALQGALIAHDFQSVIVADPAPDGLSGPGWSLDPAPGFAPGGPEQGEVRVMGAVSSTQ